MPAVPPGRDAEAVRRAFAALLAALGLDSGREPELAETPARVAEMYAELLSGLDPAQAPSPVTFPHEGAGDLVIVRDLAFHSLCVHHFVPFFGRALIAYLPGDRIMGISAAARLLDHHARRPQLQERLGREIADAIEALLRPRGVAVILEARHLCMEMRGIRRRGVVETRTVRGELADPRWTEALRFGPDPGA
jgi:GTP cyclohydrolase I